MYAALHPNGKTAAVGGGLNKPGGMLSDAEKQKFTGQGLKALNYIEAAFQFMGIAENLADTLLHVRFPEMLYNVEAMIFGVGFVMCTFFILAKPASAEDAQTYSVTLVAMASGVAAFAAYTTKKKFADFRDVYKDQLNANQMIVDGILDTGDGAGDSKFLNPSTNDTATKKKLDSMNATVSMAYRKAKLEISVDLIRYAASMVAGPLVLFDLYNMLPRKEGSIPLGAGFATLILIVMVLLATLSKLYLYDFQDRASKYQPRDFVANGVLLVAAAGGGVVILIDLLVGSDGEELQSNIWFFLLTSFCGNVFIYGMVLVIRWTEKESKTDEALRDKMTDWPAIGKYPSGTVRSLYPDTTKHLLLVAFDVLTLGLLVFGTVFSSFGQQFGPTRYYLSDDQYVVSPASPPPSPYPPPHPPH